MSLNGLAKTCMKYIDGFVMVHSGRLLPVGGDPVLRNEGL